jgi:putative Mn2+ efflux pump MntP
VNFYSLLLIALALSLDAFGVALAIGLNNSVTVKDKLLFIFSFGFFQFLFSFLGSYIGVLFNKYITSVPEIVGGTLIVIVGLMMLKEGFEKKSECILIKPEMFVILGVSVSIDAAVIGFTIFNNIASNFIVLKYTLFIGIVTLVMSSIAFLIAKFLKRIEILSEYADYVGGAILILFGIKMIFL